MRDAGRPSNLSLVDPSAGFRPRVIRLGAGLLASPTETCRAAASGRTKRMVKTSSSPSQTGGAESDWPNKIWKVKAWPPSPFLPIPPNSFLPFQTPRFGPWRYACPCPGTSPWQGSAAGSRGAAPQGQGSNAAGIRNGFALSGKIGRHKRSRGT